MMKRLTKRKKAQGQEKDDRERGKNDRTRGMLAETRMTSLTCEKKRKAKAKLSKKAERSLGS